MTKIDAGAPTAISLSHHVQGGGPQAVRAAHDAEAFHGGELPPGNHKLCGVKALSMSVDWRADGGDVVLHAVLSHCRRECGCGEDRELGQ